MYIYKCIDINVYIYMGICKAYLAADLSVAVAVHCVENEFESFERVSLHLRTTHMQSRVKGALCAYVILRTFFLFNVYS